MNVQIIAAFECVRNQRSPDAVVADPDLNRQFLAECRSRGLTDSPCTLNLHLLNARKAGLLTDLPKSKRTIVHSQDDFKFASEMAIRFLERRDQHTLDQILCDPLLADEFGKIAAKICPGRTPFEYRWAALGLRKVRKLRPEILQRVVRAKNAKSFKVTELVIDDVPMSQGLYLFFVSSEALYAGETANLRKRVSKHLDHSDNKKFARWLWEHDISDLHLEFHVLPQTTSTTVRKALEAELVVNRRPTFNITGNLR